MKNLLFIFLIGLLSVNIGCNQGESDCDITGVYYECTNTNSKIEVTSDSIRTFIEPAEPPLTIETRKYELTDCENMAIYNANGNVDMVNISHTDSTLSLDYELSGGIIIYKKE